MKNLFLFLVLGFVSVLGFGSEAGPHGGSVIENKTHSFEVSVEPESKKIHVHTLRSATKTLPPEIELRFVKGKTNLGSIHVRALDRSASLPEYQGMLKPNIDSHGGIELRFRLNGKKYRLHTR